MNDLANARLALRLLANTVVWAKQWLASKGRIRVTTSGKCFKGAGQVVCDVSAAELAAELNDPQNIFRNYTCASSYVALSGRYLPYLTVAMKAAERAILPIYASRVVPAQ